MSAWDIAIAILVGLAVWLITDLATQPKGFSGQFGVLIFTAITFALPAFLIHELPEKEEGWVAIWSLVGYATLFGCTLVLAIKLRNYEARIERLKSLVKAKEVRGR